MRGYWLSRVGGLMYGDKMYGDTELTKDQYDGLFFYAPEHRHAALACTKIGLEYDALHKQADELMKAQDEHDMAQAAAYTKCEELKGTLAALAGTEFTPEAKAEVEAAAFAAAEAHAAALNAYAAAKNAVEAIMPKLDELRDKLAECPPTRD